MFKRLIKVYFIFYFGSHCLSCATNKPLQEGLIGHKRYFINKTPGAPLPMPDNLSGKIWFQDSCVIYEVKVLNIVTNYTENGKKETESFDTYKYTYLDLRTNICQDYYSLSDTVLPICSYSLKPDEDIVWKFYAAKSDKDLVGERSTLSDTTVKGKTYKRVKVINNTRGYEYVYYLDCASKKSIFHLNKSLEELYPGCKVIRSELRGDLQDPLKSVVEINILSEQLSANEKNIFIAWRENADNNKLMILTFDEIQKRYPPPIKK